ncbi:MAG: secondary thiamine-phosphate synthase enzyme YjbQ [Minisyncoccia bacterium]|jgi:secondary thiamine-phosphate synthase enzyme
MIIEIKTNKKREIVDITDKIQEIIEKQDKNTGLVHLFALHTTCALTTADLDPGTDLDYLDTLEKIVPKLNFRHPHNPSHFPDHFLSSLIGTSLLVPFENKNLILGTWQRIILIELDGPRVRNIKVTII